MLQAIRLHHGKDRFMEWLTVALKSWDARLGAIGEMAWIDHNGDWYLHYDHIARERKFPDTDEPVTAADVAQSLNAYVEMLD